MKRLFPAQVETPTTNSSHVPEPVEDANDLVERKFHDTLEEVVALKQILQEFLAEPATRPVPPATDMAAIRSNNAPRRGADQQRESLVDSESPPRVRASRRSERMLRQSLHFEPNFQARMRYYMQKNQLKKEQIQAVVEEKTQEDLKLAPTINERSKRIHRSVHHLHAWDHEKKLKLEQLRQAERQREVEEVTSAPRVSRVSRRLSTNRVDDLALCKVEDRLHLVGLIYEYQQEEREIEAAKRACGGADFKPRLAPHSSKLVRNQCGPVHERLHELSKRQQAGTGQGQQVSPKRTKPVVTVEAAIQRLAEIGEVYRAKRAEMAQHRELQLKEMQASQKLSSKSRSLAERARSKEQEHHHRKCPCCQQPEDNESPESQRTVTSTQASTIYERQLEWLARKERKCQEERERREAEEAASLAFRNPQYRSAWDPLELVEQGDTPNNGAGNDGTNNASSPGRAQQRQQRRTNHSFFEKSTKWAEDREQQLARERKLWEEIHLRDCTFKPKLCSAPPRRNDASGQAGSPSPRSVLKSLDPGFFSRTHLRTPMLDAEGSEVSSDDCMSGEEGNDSDETSESHVVFYDHGERICSR